MKDKVNIGALRFLGKMSGKKVTLYEKMKVDEKLKAIRANKRKYGHKS